MSGMDVFAITAFCFLCIRLCEAIDGRRLETGRRTFPPSWVLTLYDDNHISAPSCSASSSVSLVEYMKALHSVVLQKQDNSSGGVVCLLLARQIPIVNCDMSRVCHSVWYSADDRVRPSRLTRSIRLSIHATLTTND